MILDATLCLSNRLTGTDHSDSSDSDEDSKADCLDYCMEDKKFNFCGAIQKSDDSGGDKVMETVHWCTTVIENDDGLASCTESTEEAAQQGAVGEEESDDSENQQAPHPGNV